jgi:hypothetical protein
MCAVNGRATCSETPHPLDARARAHPKWDSRRLGGEVPRVCCFLLCRTEGRIIVRHQHTHHRKNDLCFAFLMAAVFAVMTAGAVAGTLDLAHGHTGAEVAEAHAAQAARHDPADREPRILLSGAKW